MKSVLHLALALGLLALGGLLGSLGGGTLQAAPVATGTEASLAATRPGTPQSASDQRLTADGSVTSSILVPNAVYRLVCVQDVHYALGTSTVTATTSKMLLPGGMPFYFMTNDTARYLAVIKNATAGYCYLGEER